MRVQQRIPAGPPWRVHWYVLDPSVGTKRLLQFCFTTLQMFYSAVANHLKLSAMIQHRLVIFEFCRLQVQHRPPWAKIKPSQGCAPFGGYWGKSIYSPFPASRGCLYSLAEGLLCLQSQQCGMLKSLILWFSPLIPPSMFRDLCDYLGPICVIQETLPISKSTD